MWTPSPPRERPRALRSPDMAAVRKRVIGVIERVVVRGKRGEVRVTAKIDTGASRTTVDTDIAARAGLGPVLGTVRIRQSIAKQAETRPLVSAEFEIAGLKFDVGAAIADRHEMRYHVIVGMDILGRGSFLISPTKGRAAPAAGRPAGPKRQASVNL